MTSSEATENHLEELEKWAATQPPQYGRKLLFSEKCGIAYALKRRAVRHDIVAKAFGLSPATVSQLARCLQPTFKHYRDVYREFFRLGEMAFAEKYYTREIHFRFRRILLAMQDPEGRQDIAPKQSGPDRRAEKYATQDWRKEQDALTLPDNSHWIIGWRSDDATDWGAGWYFWPWSAPGEPQDCFGRKRAIGYSEEDEPFRTSAEAFDALYYMNGYPSPRPRPGRPKSP